MGKKAKKQIVIKDESPEDELLLRKKFIKEEFARLQTMTTIEQINWLTESLKQEFQFYLPKQEQINALKTLYGRNIPKSFSNGLLGNLAFVLRDKIKEYDTGTGFDDNVNFVYQKTEYAKRLATDNNDDYMEYKNMWLAECTAADWIVIALCGFLEIAALPAVLNMETVKHFIREM